ncbi:hypothetical protein CHU92_06725, partial [Flavobacterium cyanobacteriorum]
MGVGKSTLKAIIKILNLEQETQRISTGVSSRCPLYLPAAKAGGGEDAASIGARPGRQGLTGLPPVYRQPWQKKNLSSTFFSFSYNVKTTKTK